MLSFINQMHQQLNSGSGGTVRPSDLFGKISAKWKFYKAMAQQDSHELIRRMMDGIREEQLQVC